MDGTGGGGADTPLILALRRWCVPRRCETYVAPLAFHLCLWIYYDFSFIKTHFWSFISDAFDTLSDPPPLLISSLNMILLCSISNFTLIWLLISLGVAEQPWKAISISENLWPAMNECCNCLFSQHAHTHGPLDMHGGSVGVNGEGVGEKKMERK